MRCKDCKVKADVLYYWKDRLVCKECLKKLTLTRGAKDSFQSLC